jgi:hypothetical protein
MISQETVWQEIWPVVEALIQATLAENDEQVKVHLLPGGQAAVLHDLFGYPVFDILLKTILGRGRLGLTRAIETEEGRFVHLEYAWPDPEAQDNSYTAADVVSVKLQRHQKQWRVVEVNPANVDLPLTEARAYGILVSSKALSTAGSVPQEPWILPVALFGGALQLPLRPAALRDAVERLLLPGLQHRTYGILSVVAGRRLWRDFRRKAKPTLKKEFTAEGAKSAGKKGEKGSAVAAWAAAAEFILSEQNMREATQAAVAQNYQINLAAILPCIRQIKESLAIQGIDERYSSFRPAQIILKEADQP